MDANKVVATAPAGPAPTSATTPTSAAATAPTPTPRTRTAPGPPPPRLAHRLENPRNVSPGRRNAPDVLRRAADEVADESANQRANALLLDAAALAAIDTDETGG